jgi:hypothetical protein
MFILDPGSWILDPGCFSWILDPGCLSWILDPGSKFFHPGSRVKKDPDPNQRISVFLTEKFVSKLSEI